MSNKKKKDQKQKEKREAKGNKIAETSLSFSRLPMPNFGTLNLYSNLIFDTLNGTSSDFEKFCGAILENVCRMGADGQPLKVHNCYLLKDQIPDRCTDKEKCESIFPVYLICDDVPGYPANAGLTPNLVRFYMCDRNIYGCAFEVGHQDPKKEKTIQMCRKRLLCDDPNDEKELATKRSKFRLKDQAFLENHLDGFQSLEFEGSYRPLFNRGASQGKTKGEKKKKKSKDFKVLTGKMAILMAVQTLITTINPVNQPQVAEAMLILIVNIAEFIRFRLIRAYILLNFDNPKPALLHELDLLLFQLWKKMCRLILRMQKTQQRGKHDQEASTSSSSADPDEKREHDEASSSAADPAEKRNPYKVGSKTGDGPNLDVKTALQHVSVCVIDRECKQFVDALHH